MGVLYSKIPEEVKKQIEKLSVKYLVINTNSISLKKITNQTKLIKKKIIHFEKITFLNISSRIQPIDLIGEQKNHEIYENIIFDGKKHYSISSIMEIKDKTIIASGFSKTFAWTGGSQKIFDKGRISKYNKKFSNLRKK